MLDDHELPEVWCQLWQRLADRCLLGTPYASLSLRLPGTDDMWFGCSPEAPVRITWRLHQNANDLAMRLHARAYGHRDDAGAVLIGAGDFGRCLLDWGARMPQVFDEQARHLGPMPAAQSDGAGIHAVWPRMGNVCCVQGQILCMGMTARRLALNAELFEKCAKAHVLAIAAGGQVKPLPWWVRWIANGRLRSDQKRARARLAQGLLAEEAQGY